MSIYSQINDEWQNQHDLESLLKRLRAIGAIEVDIKKANELEFENLGDVAILKHGLK